MNLAEVVMAALALAWTCSVMVTTWTFATMGMTASNQLRAALEAADNAAETYLSGGDVNSVQTPDGLSCRVEVEEDASDASGGWTKIVATCGRASQTLWLKRPHAR
jgi:hypothetical protein